MYFQQNNGRLIHDRAGKDGTISGRSRYSAPSRRQ